MKKTICFAALLLSSAVRAMAGDYNILDFGAVADGRTLATAAIQQAVDRCSAQGGGRVVIPSGNYYTGVIFMRSGVELHLEQNARLIGSTDYKDYPDMEKERKGLIHCAGVSNIAVTGFGEIYGSGECPAFQVGGQNELRPHCILLDDCRKVNVQDVTLRNAGFWTFKIHDSREVFVRGIRIYSHSNFNNDGIDIDGRDIVVSDCLIEATDDGICFKSESPSGEPCQNIAVTNCVVASNCNAIKFGTAAKCGFRNITVSNCVIKTPAENDLFSYKSHIVPGVSVPVHNNSGIALEQVDAAVFEKVTISNIVMDNVLTPIFIRFGARRPREPRFFRDVIISNIVANGVSHMSSSITGIPGHRVEGITISNVTLNVCGGGLIDAVEKEVPEQIRMYPENKMFGPSLPAYGFYLRHVDGIVLENIRVNLEHSDRRHALWLEDAHNVRISGLEAKDHTSEQALVRIKECTNVTFTGYDGRSRIPLLMRVSGAGTGRIKLAGNDLTRVERHVERSAEVAPEAIIEKYNFE